MSRPDRYTDRIGLDMRTAYERGVSCNALAGLHGVSYTTARAWLIRAGAEMRAAVKPRSAPTGTVMVGTFVPVRQGGRSNGFSQAKSVRTTCKLCRHGILDGESAVWRTSTPLGLVHAYCEVA